MTNVSSYNPWSRHTVSATRGAMAAEGHKRENLRQRLPAPDGAAPSDRKDTLHEMAALLDDLDAPEGIAIAVRAPVGGHQRRGA